MHRISLFMGFYGSDAPLKTARLCDDDQSSYFVQFTKPFFVFYALHSYHFEFTNGDVTLVQCLRVQRMSNKAIAQAQFHPNLSNWYLSLNSFLFAFINSSYCSEEMRFWNPISSEREQKIWVEITVTRHLHLSIFLVMFNFVMSCRPNLFILVCTLVSFVSSFVNFKFLNRFSMYKTCKSL